jgi:hypothetical protein
MWRTALTIALALTVGTAAEAKDRHGFRPAEVIPGSQGTAPDRITIRDRSELPQCPNQGPIVVTPCGADETLILFDQPVYDDEGLFVVCLEKVPYCVPTGVGPEGDQPAGVDGLTMRTMIERFLSGGYEPPRGIVDLAARTDPGDPLADTTITCNDDTHVCTCVSDQDGDCEAKLAAICDSAESFGPNSGVGRDCPTVDN